MESKNDVRSGERGGRRRFLKAMGALGVTGVAGCLGGDDDDTPTPTEADTPTDTGTMETDTPTPTDTEAMETDTPTPTDTETGPQLPPDPAPLISLDVAAISPNAETLNATITNPYLFDIADGSVELEGPEGWELTPIEGTEFETLESQSVQDAAWELSLPDDVDGEYELSASVTYSAGEDTADVTATLPVTIDIWMNNEFAEVVRFGDLWENGIDDRMWENPAGEVQNGQDPSNWYEYEMDLSAFLPAGKIQIRIEDSFTEDGWGPSIWDVSLETDGEEVTYARAPYTDEEYVYENSAAIDDFSEDQQWRFADAQDYLIYEFDVPGDPDELVVEITLRNGFVFSARSSPPADVSKEDTNTTMTPALRVPYTGDSDGGVSDTGATGFFLAPEFDLPHGPTYEYVEESEVDGRDDVSAEFAFGYDEDNLYVQAEVTDDQHVAVAGADMWQADSLQIAAGGEGYGPEYGIARVDGETDVHQWVEGDESAGVDAIDATTGRDGGVTTYEATIPWNALYGEPRGEPGDNGPFSLLLNESDDDDGERDAVLGWTLPGINTEKSVDALGTLLLENPVESSDEDA